jgi:DNA-binding beta-propeller fold protein YncE
LAFSPGDDLFVSSEASNRVQRYDGESGGFISTFAFGHGLSAPLGLTFGPDGNLYVSSAGTDRVLRFDGTTGAFIDDFVSHRSGGLRSPGYLVFLSA